MQKLAGKCIFNEEGKETAVYLEFSERLLYNFTVFALSSRFLFVHPISLSISLSLPSLYFTISGDAGNEIRVNAQKPVVYFGK